VLGVDDWGLTPLSEMERRHFLEVIDDRGGSRSTVLTSQFPVDNWHDLIGSPTLADAVMERVLSNSYRLALSGETMRPVKKALQTSGKEGA
jgi:DNA replication protein DnaC